MPTKKKPEEKPETKTETKPAAEAKPAAETKPAAAEPELKPLDGADFEAARAADMDELAGRVSAKLAPSLESMTKQLEEMRVQLQMATDMIDDLGRQRAGAAPMMVSQESMHLAADEVTEILKQDRTAQFRVLEDFRHVNVVMEKGRTVEARHYKHFVAFVGGGLKVMLIPKKPQPAPAPEPEEKAEKAEPEKG